MNLSQNYFELFGLPVQFNVDQKQVRQQYRQLQTQFHPDKYAGKSASEQRLAEQFSALINTAHQTLKSPLHTAEYLLDLTGHSVNSDNMTIKDGSFLFKQMEWREALADMETGQGADVTEIENQLADLRKTVNADFKKLSDDFLNSFEQQDYPEAIQVVAKLHFVEKMKTEMDKIEDSLFEANT